MNRWPIEWYKSGALCAVFKNNSQARLNRLTGVCSYCYFVSQTRITILIAFPGETDNRTAKHFRIDRKIPS